LVRSVVTDFDSCGMAKAGGYDLLFFFFLLLNLMPASEVGPLTHWPAPPYAITLLKEVNQLMTGMLTAGLRIV